MSSTKKLDPSTALQVAFDAYSSMPLVSTHVTLLPDEPVQLIADRSPANGFGVRRARIVNKSSDAVLSVHLADAREAYEDTSGIVFAEGIQVLAGSVMQLNYRDDLRLQAVVSATCAINVTVEDK